MNKALFLGMIIPFLSYAQDQSLPKEVVRYHNRMAVFGPLHQEYERTKPDAFYVGLEGWQKYFKQHGKLSQKDKLLNTEIRLGYNFCLKKKNFLTPFVGLTYIQEKNSDNDWWLEVAQEEWVHVDAPAKNAKMLFGAVGLYYDHSFSSIFDLGFKLKGLVGGYVSSNTSSLKQPLTGLDVALPITFRFGGNRHWDYRIEPFSLSIFGSSGDCQSYFGFRNTLGYRF